MEDYIKRIIETGLANGLTVEQLLSNPQAAAKAYLDSQLKAIDKAAELIKINK
jgi:hypothetical protein